MSNGSSRRRRKPGQRTVFVATQPKSSPRASPSKRKADGNSRNRNGRNVTSKDMTNILLDNSVSTARYALDVFSLAMRFMKHPLAILLFLYVLSLILGRVSHSLSAAFAPICSIPIIGLICPRLPHSSHSDLNQHGGSSRGPPLWADFPQLVDMQGKALEALLDETADGTGLSLQIKKAEMATADLATLVRVSDLASRERLSSMLVDFSGDARETGRQLQRFSAQVSGAVDK
jgi:hypothetical protein